MRLMQVVVAATALVALIVIPAVATDTRTREVLTYPDAVFPGPSTAMEGDTLVVGAPFDDEFGADAGAVYVYTRTMDEWVETAKLKASNAQSGDRLGLLVAVDDDTIVASSSADTPLYVFERRHGGWVETAQIGAPDSRGNLLLPFDIDISKGTIVAGDPDYATEACPFGGECGAAVVFERVGRVWEESAQLVASSPWFYGDFGWSVGVEGGRIAVGEPLGGTFYEGEVYVFERHDDVWIHDATLFEPDSDVHYLDLFGWSVDISGEMVVVGQFGVQDPTQVHVFASTSDGWEVSGRLVPSDGEFVFGFGNSVAIVGDTVVAGGEDWGAYVFRLKGSVWSETMKLVPPGSAPIDTFARIVALSDDAIVVTASDAVYLFGR